jgi:hypothetical protein
VIGRTINVAMISIGEIEENREPKSTAAEFGSRGGKAAASRLISKQRVPPKRDPTCPQKPPR